MTKTDALAAMTTATAKEAAYYAHDRSAFLDWVGGRHERVLDVGCGVGSNAPWFRRHGAVEIVGVELDEPSAEQAAQAFDRVIRMPIERAMLDLEGPFDLIVCADILEHLVDPWRVVEQLARLSTGSTVLAVSAPNIRFLPAIARIAFGRGFEYRDEGIFDSTHLRFFTRPDVARLLIRGGWQPERWGGQAYGPLRTARQLAGRLTGGRSDQWLAEQICVVARPSHRPAGGPASG